MSGCSIFCSGNQPSIPQGVAGKDGKNAFSFTTTSFQMPIVGGNVTITVRNTGQFSNDFAGVGSIVFIPTAGYFEVVSKTGNNQITVENLGYSANAAPTTVIAQGQLVQPSGLKGVQGIQGLSGTNGIARLYSNQVNTSNAFMGGKIVLFTYSLLANELINDGDEVHIKMNVYYDKNQQNINIFTSADIVTVDFDGNVVQNDGLFNGFLMLEGHKGTNAFSKISIRIIKTSVSTVRIIMTYDSRLTGDAQDLDIFEDMTSLDFTSAIPIEIGVNQSTGNSIVFRSVTIDKIKA